MEKYTIIFLLVTSAHAGPQVKTVKGGEGNYVYNANSNLDRFYQNNTSGYNNAHGLYTNTQNEFSSQQSGYNSTQTEYHQGQSGINNYQSGYNQGQSGYNGAQSVYNQGQAGYNGAQSGYSHGQAGYGTGESGYNHGQSGYNNGYNQGQTGYGNQGGQMYIYTPGGQNRPQSGYNQVLGRQNATHGQHNTTGVYTMPDFERGVCYIEVPTSNLVRDRSQVPRGNGSRPDLSRIRSCCKGYIRNIHNFKLCDPVCSQECVNGLCVAPDTCSCYPDHIKNAGGFCIPTCPIGCQNGDCAGGECLCKNGYTLDREGKYCLPKCDNGCGKQGNCTAPNVCECKSGYRSSPTGGCSPHCDSCKDGDCIGPNVCVCRHGYKLENGKCIPECSQGCGTNGRCVGPNVCGCLNDQVFDTATRECKPKCTRKCTNGECYGANTCRCFPGYTMNQVGDCTPVCSPGCGFHGECAAPNTCRCQAGYNNKHGECKPDERPTESSHTTQSNHNTQSSHTTPPSQYGQYGHYGQWEQGQMVEQFTECSQPCVNGICSGGVCICNPGYQIDTADPSGNRCIPSCPGGCLNGVCSAPNFCICDPGYVKDRSVKGSQRCVKRNKRSVEEPKIVDQLIYKLPDY